MHEIKLGYEAKLKSYNYWVGSTRAYQKQDLTKGAHKRSLNPKVKLKGAYYILDKPH